MKVYIVYNFDTVYLEACYVTQRIVEGVFQSREDAEAYVSDMDWGDGEVAVRKVR